MVLRDLCRLRRGLSCTLVLVWVFAAAEVGRAAEVRDRYCGLIAACDLRPVPALCSAWTQSQTGNVDYGPEHCLFAQRINRAGLAPVGTDGYTVFAYLGGPRRVEYGVQGNVPLTSRQLGIVMGDLVLAAQLVAVAGYGDYRAEYLNAERGEVQAAKGRNFQGRARPVAGDPAQGRVVYFGHGGAKILWWEFGGRVVLDFAFRPLDTTPQRSAYRARLAAAPQSGLLARIMEQEIFRRLVRRLVDDVLRDLAAAVWTVGRDPELRRHLASELSLAQRQKLARLLAPVSAEQPPH